MQRRRGMIWAVHQLDADTTGVNVFVSKKSLVPQLQQRMRYPNAQKQYLAVVHGVPPFDTLRVDQPIGFVKSETFSGQAVRPEGKPSATRFEVVRRGGAHALVRATLESGRTHQVRVHLAHLGHPLVGEEWYRQPACELHNRQALHAERIVFHDNDEPRELVAPLAQDLIDLLDRLGLNSANLGFRFGRAVD